MHGGSVMKSQGLVTVSESARSRATRRSIPPGYLGMHVAIDQTASAKMPGRSSWTAPGIRPGDHWPW